MKKYISARAHHSLFIAWFICSLSALFYTYEYLLRIEPGIMVNDLRVYFSLSAGGLGLLASMYYWGYTPLQLVVGLITDYFGARRVLISAILACALGAFLFGYTHNYYIASFARLLMGVGSAFAFVGALKLGADWLPRRHFPFFVGLCTSLGMLGAMFGETAMSWMTEHLGWHPVIWDSVWLGVALVAIFSLFVYEKHELVSHEHRIDPINIKALGRVLVRLLSKKRILQAGLIGCATYLSLSVLAVQWGNVFLQKVLNTHAQEASYYVDMLFFGWFVGAPISGYVSEKMKSRKLVLFYGSMLALICFLPIICVPRMLPHWLLALLLFLYAFFCSSEINCFSVTRDLVETRLAATAAGLMNAMVMVSGMFIQPLFGYSLNWFSVAYNKVPGEYTYSLLTYQKALLIIPIFLVIACIVAWRMDDTYAIAAGKQQRQRIRL